MKGLSAWEIIQISICHWLAHIQILSSRKYPYPEIFPFLSLRFSIAKFFAQTVNYLTV
jgi:hypothetical protein